MSKQMIKLMAVACIAVMGTSIFSYKSAWALEIQDSDELEGVGDGWLPPAVTCGDFEYYDLGDGVIQICRYNGTDENVIIPSEVDGKTVTSVCSGTLYNALNVKTVEVPATINSLDSMSFAGPANLQSINVSKDNETYCSIDGIVYTKDMSYLVECPNSVSGIFKVHDGVKGIMSEALRTCKGITGIILPKEFQNIEINMFKNFEYFNSIEVSPDNEKYASKDGVLYNKDKSEVIYCPRDLEGKCTLADETTTISSDAFKDCTKITSMYIPDNLASFTYTFDSCTSLKDYEVSENNTQYISEDGVLYLKENENTLAMCPPGREGTFVIKDGIETIYDHAFNNCAKLEKIVVPDSVTNLYFGVFFGCSNLKSVNLPQNLTQLNGCTFTNCSSLSDIKLPPIIKTIFYHNFYGCTSLTSIELPDTVEKIEQNTFYRCTSLKTINIPAATKEIALDFGNFGGSTSLESINVDSENENYASVDGILYSKDKTQLLAYPEGKSKDIKISDTTTGIGTYAFNENKNFNIHIPNSVTSISDSAFKNCVDFIIYGEEGSYAQSYAQSHGYKFNKYRVTLMDDEGKQVGNIMYVDPDSIIIPSYQPEKEGYTFIAWDKQLDKITEDTVMKPIYIKNDSGSGETEKPDNPSDDNTQDTPQGPAQDKGEEGTDDSSKGDETSTNTPGIPDETTTTPGGNQTSTITPEKLDDASDGDSKKEEDTSQNTSDANSILGLFTMALGFAGTIGFKKKH